MFLSKVELNATNYKVRVDLRNCCKMHSSIMSLFPKISRSLICNNDSGDRKYYNVLYRLENNGKTGSRLMLIQSDVEPNFLNLPKGYFVPDSVFVKDITPLLLRLDNNFTIRFKLLACPYFRDNKTRVRAPIKKTEDQAQWLERKGVQYGFEILQLINISKTSQPIKGRKIGRPSIPINVYLPVTFEGFIKIVSKDLFLKGFRSGIGPYKCYGCGLLSIA